MKSADKETETRSRVAAVILEESGFGSGLYAERLSDGDRAVIESVYGRPVVSDTGTTWWPSRYLAEVAS
jgi:hypothetical protein